MESNKTILVDLMADVVDLMRQTGDITDSIETSGTYVLTSENTLTDNEVVNIDSEDYIVSNVSSSSFTIEGETGLVFIGKSFKALAPYYEHGHILEIANTLNAKSGGIYCYQKYPLVILFQDYKGTRSTENDALFGSVSAHLAVCNISESELKSNERYDLNFRDILFPRYDQLLQAINDSGYFDTSSSDAVVDHDWYERPYWGSYLAQTKNILNDFIDAIELENVDLNILSGAKQNC